MKVGTDGTLLGAWALASAGPCRVLDVGTGTGLIALMMAQRYPEAQVIAIDIDEKAVFQAQENVLASPFDDRIQVLKADVQTFEDSEKFGKSSIPSSAIRRFSRIHSSVLIPSARRQGIPSRWVITS